MKTLRYFTGLLFLAPLVGCQPPNVKVVDRLPPPEPGPPLVQTRGPFIRKPPAVVAKPSQPAMDNERAWTPPGGFSNRWRYVIIHHSGEDRGSPAGIDSWHRQKGWDEMGYHFVIGNGNGYEDGRVFVGPRWPKQKHGAHTRVSKNDDNRWNEHGIGICLIGNYETGRPSARQMESLTRLVAFLSRQCHIPTSQVTTHGGVDPQTKCPGRHFSVGPVRQRVAALQRERPIHASAH